MRIFMNFQAVNGPYGGANSFLKALCKILVAKGIEIVTDINRPFDLAFLNALTNNLDIDFVKRIAQFNVPIIHRKVGYVVSGSADMRKQINNVVWGDKLQIDFSPYIHHTIFQSAYSRDVFLYSGFEGDYTVIPNGVDENIFNCLAPGLWGLFGKQRQYWQPGKPLKVIISSWSKDHNKGFEEYARIDQALAGIQNTQVSFVGRTPDDLTFCNIRTYKARGQRRLAFLLKQHHVLLQLAKKETCSNALIEGITCGLPVIYLDSGSNMEIAATYGVAYQGNFLESVEAIKTQYASSIANISDNPYRIKHVAEQYLTTIVNVLEEYKSTPQKAQTQVANS